MMGRRLISRDDIREKGITFSDAQLWRLIKAGSFPKPVPLGTRKRAWLESEIDEFVDGLVRQRDGAAA